MVIYNITFNVEEYLSVKWQNWLKTYFIPQHYDTGFFIGHLFSEVLVAEEMGGITFSLQFFMPNMLMYKNFMEIHSERLEGILVQEFGNNFVFFSTNMQNIDFQFPSK